MHVQTFRAESLQAALQQVRQTLGPDAAIVQTRQTRHSRLGLFSKTVIEVEATADYHSDFQPPIGDSVQSALSEISAEPTSNTLRAVASPAMLEVRDELLAAGVPEQLAISLLSEVQRLGAWVAMNPVQSSPQRDDARALRRCLSKLIASNLCVSGPIQLNNKADARPHARPEVVAMIGPTGAGKTTTLAKIAAGFRFNLGCRVGLIALDTFRLGAVDQLLQYAELISAALEVVSAPEQVTPALERLSDCDVVLLDTAGRALNDLAQFSELKKFLRLANPQSTQLVVSANSSLAYVVESIRKYAQLEPSNLLITKLDEAVAFGSWLPVLRTCPLPISYLTTGQHVPDDIVEASPQGLTSLVLGIDNHD